MSTDFEKNKSWCCCSSETNNKPAKTVDSFRYLRTVFDCQLKWGVNTEHIVKRDQ